MLAEAAGNPLALVELPHVVDDVSALEPLPLNDRLERAFAVDRLPSPARLLAAPRRGRTGLHDGAAARRRRDRAHGAPRTSRADGEALRSATRCSPRRSTTPLRCSSARPRTERSPSCSRRTRDRRAWHRAAATLGTDDDASAELSDAAARARRRGATMASVAMLERAAALTSEGARRSDLLLRAAEQACELGRTATATRLVGRTELEPLGPVQRGRLLAIRDLVDPGELLDPARIEALVAAAERRRGARHRPRARAALARRRRAAGGAARRRELRLPVAAAAERLAPRTTTYGCWRSSPTRTRSTVAATSWTGWPR